MKVEYWTLSGSKSTAYVSEHTRDDDGRYVARDKYTDTRMYLKWIVDGWREVHA